MLARQMRNARHEARKTFKGCKIYPRTFSAVCHNNVVRSTFPDITLPNSTLHEYIWQNMDKWADRTAMVCGVTGHGYTYEQLFRLTTNLAANLRKRFGLYDGACVAGMLPNSPEFPIVSLAVSMAGGCFSGINPMYTAHEVQRQLTLTNAKIIFTTAALVPTIREAFQMANMNIPIIVLKSPEESTPNGTVLLNELSEDNHVDKTCLKEVRSSTEDVIFLPCSSGTTGLPKGVELTHRNIIANCEQMGEPAIRHSAETTSTHQDVTLAVLPFFHIYACTVQMCQHLSRGLKVVTLPRFQPEEFMKTILKYRTNLLYTAPPMVLAMTSHPASSAKVLEPVKLIMSGAAPLPAVDVDRLFEKAKRKFDFVQGYGLTETGPVVTMNRRGDENYASVGYALPSTELMIVSSDGKPVEEGEMGELLVRGPQVMRGYHQNPEATAEALAGGWFHTGDLVRMNENGAFYVADRLKELIKVKGYQVPPAELESVLREHPSVLDAAVVGVPDPKYGEIPRAFVIPKEGVKADTDDIIQFVAKRVAPYKRIGHIQLIDSIPKNPSGKILRRVIKEKYC